MHLDVFHVDGASDDRLQARWCFCLGEDVQPPIIQVANAGSKAEAKQMTQAEHMIGDTATGATSADI